MDNIRVLIADDHAVVRQGIRMITNTEPSIQIVGEAEDGMEAVRQAKALNPDVILMDLVMPHGGGVEAITKIKPDYPHIKIIVLTTFEDGDRINAAVEAGADGYLLKDADGEALLQAIYSAQRGEMPLHPRVARQLFSGRSKQAQPASGTRLTEREKQVLQLVAKGLSNKEVAQLLQLTEGTVKVHVSNILGKLNVSTRTEAAVLATQMGLVDPITSEEDDQEA